MASGQSHRYVDSLEGFTLIELLVVISIIALLSTVILAALGNARQKAQYASVQESLIQMRNVYELYYTSNGTYGPLLPYGEQSIAIGYGCSGGLSNTFTAGPSGQNFCTITNFGSSNLTACDTLLGLVPNADAICKDIVTKMGSNGTFDYGVSGTTFISTDYAFVVTNPSNSSSYFCIRSNGSNMTLVSNIQSCLNKDIW